MKLRELLRKLNDAIRPVHIEGQPTNIDRMYDAKNSTDLVASLPRSDDGGLQPGDEAQK